MNAAYRDSGQPPAWLHSLRWLNASFRLGRFFSVEVLVYWMAIVLLPIIFWAEYGRAGFSGAELAAVALCSSVLLLFVVWTHEMGHIVAARRYGVETSHISLSPLGGLAHLNTPSPSPKADIFISLAGPLVHVPWILICLAARWWIPASLGRPDGWVYGPLQFSVEFLYSLNLVVFVFNLLPFFPLDGGRVLRAWLSLRTHPNRATLIACRIGKLGAIALGIIALLGLFGIFGPSWWSVILLVIAISGYLTCSREMIAARYELSPFSTEQRAAWQGDPDAWKSGGQPATAAKEHARRTKRTERDATRKAEEREALRAEVDRLLDKVAGAGMAGLTPRERKHLKRASKKLAEYNS